VPIIMLTGHDTDSDATYNATHGSHAIGPGNDLSSSPLSRAPAGSLHP
jgi:hypothetical protein